ncbi:MAG TPA: hypothetical protein VK511_00415 [Gemmatimonadaceae bacterium]|nr:hypothetical protein [Gemmatimonadaceae bacterium]
MASFMTSSARFVRPLMLASCIAVLAACGSDSSGPSNDADVSGQYNLETVDGHALPDTTSNSEHVLVLATANVLFSDNGTYEASVTGTDNGSAEQEIAADNGTFVIAGNTITLHSAVFFTSYQATVASNDEVTATVPGAFVSSSNATIALKFAKAD